MQRGCEMVRVASLEGLAEAFAMLDSGSSVLLDTGGPLVAAPPIPEGRGPCLGMTSSGSTGLPKVVWRAWEALLGEVRGGERAKGWHWASPFLPWTFAGVMVALQAWRTGGRVTGMSGLGWGDGWGLARKEGWDAVSMTPTYMDLWVQNEPPGMEGVRIRQVTLGGEALRPGCASRLRRRFPDAEFVVVYASAEWGVLLKTRRMDGWYETDSLDRRRPGWRVEEGVLELPLEGGGWGATGDLVEREGDLVRVVGRADRVANVAGSKVNLDEVSRFAEMVPGVMRAVAMAEANPVTGQVVALHYESVAGEDPVALEGRIAGFLREKLPKVGWPRKWNRAEVLPEVNGKRRIRAA